MTASLLRATLLVCLLSTCTSILAAPGIIIFEKRDAKLNVFQLVKYVTPEKTSYSLVKRDPNGRFEWSVTAWEYEKEPKSELGFLLTVSRKGALLSRWPIREGDPGIRVGLFLQKNSITAILNLNEAATSRGSLPAFNEALLQESAQLRQHYYPKVCGVLAFLKVMNTEQQTTDGKEIFALITNKEPDFPDRCPKLSKGITQLIDVANTEGKVKIKVNDYIDLNNVRVADDSQFSIVQGENGNMRVVVEHGIQVTKSIGFTFKKPLNFIDVEAATGHLTFNYGNNKSKRVLIDEILKK